MSTKKTGDGIEKINSDFIQRDSKRIKESETAPTESDSDEKNELHWKALDLKEMQSKALSSPEVRPGKVEQIKKQVENGTYIISTEKIAECLIEEAIDSAALRWATAS